MSSTVTRTVYFDREPDRRPEQAVRRDRGVVRRQVDALVAAQQRPVAGRHADDEEQWRDEEDGHEDDRWRDVAEPEQLVGSSPRSPRPAGPGRRSGQGCVHGGFQETSWRSSGPSVQGDSPTAVGPAPAPMVPLEEEAYWPASEAVTLSLSASTLLGSPNTASRVRTSHGPFGSLKVWPKFLASGVTPLPATWLIATTRGSAAAYLLLARSDAGDHVAALGHDLDLGVVAERPGEEVPGLVGDLAVRRDADRVAADERRLCRR